MTSRNVQLYVSPTLACLAWRDPIGSHGRMRTTLIIACAIVVFAAGAQAQDALKPCRQIKEDGKRLKCYDRLDRPSSNARERLGQSRPGGDTAWVITDEKSPLNDSPFVSAALPSSDDRSHLLMRCKDRKTEVAVSSSGFINCGPDVRVIYRTGQEQPVETRWRSHRSCYLALAPTPIPFIRALADHGKVFVRMYDNHDAPYDALFSLGNVSKIRSRLAEACEWDAASTSSGNSAPHAPTPAAAPGAPSGRPK
jgi:Type VI secretion system VasI, EvfG, VC_A0118